VIVVPELEAAVGDYAAAGFTVVRGVGTISEPTMR
jgi:hypothetical protein